MNKVLSERVDLAVERLLDDLVGPPGPDSKLLYLFMNLVTAASRYWTRVDPTDFCIQLVTPDCIIFGGVNRLIWTPAFGFKPDRSYCTPQFLETCDSLGRAPGAEPHTVSE